MVTNVLLDTVIGTISSCACSESGNVVYLGRYGSYDPAMRNLVVASLDPSGHVVDIPKSYPTSAWALARIGGYPAASGCNTSITSIVLNPAAKRLYMGEKRSAAAADLTTSGLNVYTLDAEGYPSGAVRTCADGNTWGNGALWALLLHPHLPLLYMVGFGMPGVAVQELDSSGEPTGTLTFHETGPVGKISLGISGDVRFLYLGTYGDVLEVANLDNDGRPTGVFTSHIVSNPAVGTDSGYLRFAMGAHAVCMARPDPSDAARNILAVWPLDSATGQPIGSALARPDIHPASGDSGVDNPLVPLAVDDRGSRLWLAIPTTTADAFTGVTVDDGITPTGYAIIAGGTLGAGAAGPSVLGVASAALLMPAGDPGRPLFLNRSAVPPLYVNQSVVPPVNRLFVRVGASR